MTLFYLFFPGHHSEARTSLYLSICSKACKVATDILRQGGSAIDAAAAATMVLEDAGETNAGYGSNLTELGTIVYTSSSSSSSWTFVDYFAIVLYSF